MIEFLKWAAVALGALLVLVLLVTLFADELVRWFGPDDIESFGYSASEVPKEARVVIWPWFVETFGLGAGGGKAAAITTGYTIVLHELFANVDYLHEKLRHEAVHVEQRIRYGRLYLPRYLVLFAVAFLLHGRKAHAHHALENEARTKAGQV